MRFFLLSLFLFATTVAMANVYVYTGVYQGKDLYVKNPFAPDGVGFCVFEVLVNGEVTSDEVNSSAFAIDLGLFGFNMGQAVEVVIRTKDSCEPSLVNPAAIAPESTFELQSLSSPERGLVRFSTMNEVGPLPFVVEQFKWNKWVEVAEVDGQGLSDKANVYNVNVPLHSGMNTFRVVQRDVNGARISAKKEVEGLDVEVVILSEKFTNYLEFSSETSYEVYNVYGLVVASGYGKKVDATAWKPGTFYVNFDQHFGRTVRKR